MKGQPVIVRDVLDLTNGLSWEPPVMCRGLRKNKTKNNNDGRFTVEAVECLTGCKVTAIVMIIDFIVPLLQATC